MLPRISRLIVFNKKVRQLFNFYRLFHILAKSKAAVPIIADSIKLFQLR